MRRCMHLWAIQRFFIDLLPGSETRPFRFHSPSLRIWKPVRIINSVKALVLHLCTGPTGDTIQRRPRCRPHKLLPPQRVLPHPYQRLPAPYRCTARQRPRRQPTRLRKSPRQQVWEGCCCSKGWWWELWGIVCHKWPSVTCCQGGCWRPGCVRCDSSPSAV